MAQKSSFVPCLAWIKRGVAKEKPEQFVVTQEELKRIIDDTKEEMNEIGIPTNSDPSDPSTSGYEPMETDTTTETDDVVDRYGFDDYDNDSDEEADLQNPLPSVAGLAFYASNDDDPYITLKDKDVNDSDDEDLEIKPDDNMLAIARVKENENILEFFVYNEANDDLYVHHDILLTHFPLCVEWLDYRPGDGEKGNYVALGGMEPVIEIWNVDVLNALEPGHVLGQKKAKKSSKKKTTGHQDAILDLSWNNNLRNALASASADSTIALWDLEKSTVVKKLKKHSDKVQTVAWHPSESQTLLSGSFDKTAVMYDCRDPQNANRAWKLNGEVERVLWNHFQPNTFVMSTDKGFVYMGDMRSDKVLFTLSAHSEACTGLALSSSVPDFLVTASSDHTVKAWDIANNSPKMVHEQSLKQGEVHCISACPDSPFIFAAGCQKDMKLWNWKGNKNIAQQFENRVVKPKQKGSSGGKTHKKGASKSND